MKSKYAFIGQLLIMLLSSCGREEEPLPGTVSGVTLTGENVLPSVMVVLSDAKTVIDQTVSNSSGLYSFSNVVPGDYQITASLAGYEDFNSTVTVSEAENVSMAIDMVALTGDLTGKVIDFMETGVPAVLVVLKKDNEILAETESNSSGSFSFEDIPNGEYELIATKERFVTYSSTVEIGEDGDAELIVVLQALFATIQGTVEDKTSNQRLADARVVLKTGSVVVLETMTNDSGDFLFEDIEFKSYSLQASAPMYQTATETFQLTEETGIILSITLEPQFSAVTGVVTDALTAAPLDGVKVALMQGSETVKSVTSGQGGAYEIQQIPFGNYILQFDLPGYSTKQEALAVTNGTPLIKDIAISRSIDSEVTVNLYYPQSTATELNVPQLTIKNEEVQITAIGNNFNGEQTEITQVYISDVETLTEWLVLLDEAKKPTFFYAINSLTREKEPYLYWLVSQSTTGSVIRFYEYDWENRLGTLQYEAKVSNDEVEILYDNETATSGRAGKPKDSTPAPVYQFDRLNARFGHIVGRSNNESLDQWFDSQVQDLMSILQDTKTDLINAPCRVSEILNKSDRNFICKLSDQINQLTDEEFFNDFSRATEEIQTGSGFEFEGLSINLNVDFFEDFSISVDIERHINDFRNRLDGFTLDSFFDDLVVTADVEGAELDDLSDSNGVIHVGLTWDTATDIDLHLTDPLGEEIYFSNRSSNSGGYLDLDDTNGFGPENIYFRENIPDGNYLVELVYYAPSGGPATNFVVKAINGLGSEKTFTGTISYSGRVKVFITNITKAGSSLTFN